MEKNRISKAGTFVLVFIGAFLVIRYLFPIILPFLIGSGIAAAAMPGSRFLQERLHMPRALACFLGVTAVLILTAGILGVLCALGYRELSALAGMIPDAVRQLTDQVSRLRQWLLELTHRLPAGVGTAAEQAVTDLFTNGSILLEKAASGLMGAIAAIVGGLPGGAMLLGTAVISGYMIAAQMPAIRRRVLGSPVWRERIAPVSQRLRQSVGCWLRAQVKLAGITFAIVWAGLLLLHTRYSLFWALLIAAVDAVPMLGTGTILIPWAVLLVLQGQVVRAVGMAGIYLAAMLIRSAMEPKLVGRHLGLNPLVTLAALYAGYRLWGVMGMILSPILAVTASQLASVGKGDLN